MSRSVNRNAGNGRFITPQAASKNPSRSTTERVGPGTSNSRAVPRSAATGRFVTPDQARRNPGTTIWQKI